MVSAYLYVLISLTDYNDESDLFDSCGIVLLTILMITLGVNFIKFLFTAIRDLYSKLKQKFCKKKLKKYQNTPKVASKIKMETTNVKNGSSKKSETKKTNKDSFY